MTRYVYFYQLGHCLKKEINCFVSLVYLQARHRVADLLGMGLVICWLVSKTDFQVLCGASVSFRHSVVINKNVLISNTFVAKNSNMFQSKNLSL